MKLAAFLIRGCACFQGFGTAEENYCIQLNGPFKKQPGDYLIPPLKLQNLTETTPGVALTRALFASAKRKHEQ